MKLWKAVMSAALFIVVMLCGAYFLYDRNDTADESNVIVSEELSAGAEAQTQYGDIFISDNADDPEAPAPKKQEFTEISLSFLGDCILSSNYDDTRSGTFIESAKSEPDSYFFEKALPYYKDSDYVVANCEFVMSDDKLQRIAKDGTAFWFKSPTSFSSIFRAGGIDMVSIANNHTYDYGEEGYRDTKNALDNEGITWSDIDHPVYITKHGVTFGIICTKMFGKSFDEMITPVIEEVKRDSDIQILYFHGGTEKQHEPDDWLVEMCHKYADMGIDLIVGSHPHVLRPMENYNGTDIIYSLGNFCYGANRQPENRTAILTETFTFDKNGIFVSQQAEFTPFYVYSGNENNWQPSPIEDPMEKAQVISFMSGSITSFN